MALHISAGGSANIIIDGSKGVVWDLTGLDSAGRVLNSINVKIINGDAPVDTVYLLLPSIKKINVRNVIFNIDFNDYTGTILVVANNNQEKINGVQNFELQYPENAVIPISVGSSDNWILQSLFVVPI